MSSNGCNYEKLSEQQVSVLEEAFKTSRHPDFTSLMLISAECGLSEKQTQEWFERRNAQWRQAEGLPATLGKVFD
ncbi:homeodomain-only protein [Cheilinus undulatus]|uniref:homeodomain-only protein n=1 Tax=Cheilinus undulatus TaxID=241271 RepID=UPI001BD2005C|nr:homeodomain-only protein [Cheilinus undulatus]